jgi:hypothetical protein
MLFDPAGDLEVRRLRRHVLWIRLEDVIQLALAYLHRDPNSQSLEDLKAAEQRGHGGAALYPHVRLQ